jgi:hypothetical protein
MSTDLSDGEYATPAIKLARTPALPMQLDSAWKLKLPRQPVGKQTPMRLVASVRAEEAPADRGAA